MLRAGPGTALLLDAAGTLLHPAEPVAETYARHARAHGVELGPEQVASRFAAVMREAAPLRRAAPDWRPYWRAVVAHSTGSDDPSLLAALIDHFRAPGAWTLAPGAEDCCTCVRGLGMKVGVVSNWDIHLRALLDGLGVCAWVDAIVISAEEQLEKPDPAMFVRACARLGVEPGAAVHVGDDRRADVEGARAAGCAALLFGHDVRDFDELCETLAPRTAS